MKDEKSKTIYNVEEMVKVFKEESLKSNLHLINGIPIYGIEDYIKAKEKEDMKFEPRIVNGKIVSIDLIKN